MHTSRARFGLLCSSADLLGRLRRAESSCRRHPVVLDQRHYRVIPRTSYLEAIRASSPFLLHMFRGISPVDFVVSLFALSRLTAGTCNSRRVVESEGTYNGGFPCPGAAELHDATCSLRFANAAFGWKGLAFFRLVDPTSPGGPTWGAVLKAALRGDSAAACLFAGIPPHALLLASPRARPLLPAHFVFVDEPRRAIVLAIRGTLSLADLLTDLQPWRVPFPEASTRSPTPWAADSLPLRGSSSLVAFCGMAWSARGVLESAAPVIDEALAARPGWRLIVTGVSLGAGTALLSTALIEAQRHRRRCGSMGLELPPGFAFAPLVCHAFAPPPVLAVNPDDGASSASATEALVCSFPATSWFFSDDPIPRLSEDRYAAGRSRGVRQCMYPAQSGITWRPTPLPLIRPPCSSAELLTALARITAAVPSRLERLRMTPEARVRALAALAGERPSWRRAWGIGEGSGSAGSDVSAPVMPAGAVPSTPPAPPSAPPQLIIPGAIFHVQQQQQQQQQRSDSGGCGFEVRRVAASDPCLAAPRFLPGPLRLHIPDLLLRGLRALSSAAPPQMTR